MANEKTAIVTGAGTGIGKAVATALLQNGWNTVFAAAARRCSTRRSRRPATTEARALAVACDVTKPEQVEELFETAAEAFGRVDLLFNNAGMGFKTTADRRDSGRGVERHRRRSI